MGPDSTNVVTLANSIIGVGILAMPFCFQKCGILLSIVLLLLSNFVTRLSCHYLAKASILSRRRNYEYLAFYAFGSSGKLMVELCIIGYLFGSSVAYHVVVGDLGPQMISQIFNITNSDNLRLWVLILMTALVIFPLGLLKNIDSLSAVCSASIAFYFCFVLKVIGESKEPLVSGDWKNHVNWWKPSGLLQCLPIFSMALSCQMQLFEVSETMPGISLDRMNKEVKSATWICTIVYILVGFFGYVAFCTQEFSGNILVNLSQSISSDVIKIGFVISIAFSFPLVIFPCRASLYSLFYLQGHMEANPYIPENKFRALTATIAFCSLIVGLVIPSVELVIGLVGSTIGIAICIVFPSCCFVKVSKKDSTEKALAKFMIVCGFCLMVLGTYANLSAIDDKAATGHALVPEPHHLPEISLKEPVMERGSEIEKEILAKLEYKVGEEGKREQDLMKEKDRPQVDLISDKKAEVVEPKMVESENKKIEEVVINNDAIRKEEEEELTADKDSKVVVQQELNAAVDEIKRQNEESQKRVLEKLEEIVEKIEQKLDPGPVAAEVKPDKTEDKEINQEVRDQVRGMYPDPIPLRALNNNNNVIIESAKEIAKESQQVENIVLEKGINDVVINSKAILQNETKEAVAIGEKQKEIEELKELKEEVEAIKKEVVLLNDRKAENVEDDPKKPIEVDGDTVNNNNNNNTEVQSGGDNKEKVVNHDEDVEAIRRDLLNVDNDESLARLKRNADCEKEI